ncbi:MAG: hypothetical protein MJ184_05625 [Treponema sp.]|uniref:tetratricopeptide repeat protein n=1 Tax=Treponema sp. TaxID=166 RepID=UPI00298D7B38|nr:hypothetical protein [Treponema sp.]MCQ2600823.1 hypothetical protein [Treponema sp.]
MAEYQNRNFDQAILIADNILKEKKNFDAANFLKAKASFFKNDFYTAEKTLQMLGKKHPENFDYKLWLLRTYFLSEKLKEADELIAELKENNSEDWRLFYWQALIAKSQNNFEKYFLSLNSAEQVLKETSFIYKELAVIWMELGMADRYMKYTEKKEVLTK